jgi:carbon-monoxide dehydrogenase medium subunit
LVQRAICLVESCGVVGGPQVRHVGTLGGNVAHALPAGDGTTSLVALDAEVEFIQAGSRRWAPILAMFAGPGRSILDSTRDVLIRFKLKGCGEREGCAFKRIMRPQGVALPILGCAVWVALDETCENFADVRLCLAPVAPTPIRPRQTEAALIGRPVNGATIDRALAVAAEELHPRTSKYRATAEYRQMMIDVLLRQALPLAVKRARTGEAIPEFGA